MSGPVWELYLPIITGLISCLSLLLFAVLGFNYLHRGAHASDGSAGRWDD